jgi:hypothetical protein
MNLEDIDLIESKIKISESIPKTVIYMTKVQPTSYQISRLEKTIKYLDKLKGEAIESNGSDSIIYYTFAVLDYFAKQVYKQNRILEIPDISPSHFNSANNLHLYLIWDKDEHYLECEVFPDKTLSFSYSNFLTKEDWGEDLKDPIFKELENNSELLEKLLLFIE